MSEKIRDGFESWCKTLGFNIDKFDGDYIIASTDWAWKIWQASRAALVVELPEKAALMSASSVYAALDDAGVAYK